MIDETRRHSSDSIIYHFNANNAKKIALLLVIFLIFYHSILHYSYGIDSCKWLLSDGRFQGYRVWQPFGCMLHIYTKIDARTCLRYIAYWGGKNHIVFMGDSRIRQMYSTFVQLIFSEEETIQETAHFDMSKEGKDLRLKVEFLWRPTINDSMFQVYRDWLKFESSQQPKLIITGSGTWSIKSSNASLEALEDYKANLTRLLPYMDKLNSKLLWVLQDPVIPEKLSPNRLMISNEQIDLYNKAAINTLKYSTSEKVHIWSSSRLVSQGYNKDQKDGLHMGQVALNYAIQMLLNLYCNDQMNHNDGTCCSNPENITTIQLITFSFFTICIILAVISYLRQYFKSHHKSKWQLIVNQENISNLCTKKNIEKSYHELITSLGKFGLILYFFFLCDRTNFFMRENKYYTHFNFFLPLAYLFCLGIFFTEESIHTTVLHRDQTDEWKGWMQLIILIYHMTGASQVLPIYLYIRVLVSSYLFLTGYGHFCYFWRTGDFGFHRVWQIIFRLNILVVFLCLAMNRPYQFYYFVPLITFWFLVLYFTMSSFPQITNIFCEANSIHYLYVILKFVAQMIVITILYMSEVFFERIFLTRPWKALFVTTDDSIKEWWFRWKVDRYSVSAGMIFGFFYHLMKKFHIFNDNNHGNLFFKGISLIVTFFSIIGVLSYAGFLLTCRNKEECNEIHSYVFFIPVISYIALRNISGLLRSKYSIFFAWFGKISLELFICQYHIWLAANTHGILVLIPYYPVLNVIVTSFIFVCISHELHFLVQILINYAIPTDWRYMIRNLLIFFLLLIPIGIKDNMF